MNKNGRNVIDRLQSIEDSLNHSEKSISEQIEEDFVEYFNESTVYYYEDDVRKFDYFIKKQKTLLLKNLILCLIWLVFNIISSIYIKKIIPLIFVIQILFFLELIFCYIFLRKQKPKKLSFSNFNIKNITFYIFNNSLNFEHSQGTIHKVFIIFKSFVVIFSLISFVFTSIKHHNYLLFFFNIIFSNFLSKLFINKEYTYQKFIFENSNSYIVTDLNSWKKYTK